MDLTFRKVKKYILDAFSPDFGQNITLAIHSFDNGYVGKQPMAWKEYSALVQKLQESIDTWCIGRRDVTEKLLKNGVKHQYNQSINYYYIRD